ncbi:MAG: HIG1 domain-containing protein [Alphaproteobacteria bacterium]|nr:HIG1 domain-containing protein [Alphaproteobacteria bacterium]
MRALLGILVVIGLLATLAVLLVGVFAMAKSGDFNRKYGNLLMRARVITQGATLALILAWFLVE